MKQVIIAIAAVVLVGCAGVSKNELLKNNEERPIILPASAGAGTTKATSVFGFGVISLDDVLDRTRALPEGQRVAHEGVVGSVSLSLPQPWAKPGDSFATEQYGCGP